MKLVYALPPFAISGSVVAKDTNPAIEARKSYLTEYKQWAKQSGYCLRLVTGCCSLMRCIQRKFIPSSLECQAHLSHGSSGSLAGMPAAFAEATAHIHGIGWRWRKWLAFRWMHEQLTLNLIDE